MSLSEDDILDLMAYADGEVEEGKVARVDALIAKSDAARRFLEQHGALRQWVVGAFDASATKGGADGIAEAVMAKIGESEGAPVVSLAGARARAGRAVQRRRIPWSGAFAAVAAAVALFYFWPRGEAAPKGPVATQEGKAAGPKAPPLLPPSVEAPGSPAAVASAELPEEPGIDVQAVESPQHQFSIFYMPGATGANAHASSVVVWIGEE